VGGTSNTGILNNFTFPASMSYEVDLWHRIRNTVAANTFQAQASAADVFTATLSTQAELAQDYFEIRALDVQRQILRETIANYRQTLELTNARYRGGIASDEDVSQAQTQLDLTIAQETDLGVNRAAFEHAIAALIGKAPANFALAPAPFVPNPPPVPVVLPSELLERRPDIAGSERQVAAANAQIGIARAAYYPRLTLSATGGFQTSRFNQWFTWPSNFWSLGPSFGQVLFDAGARRALTEQARANYDATVANYRQTVLTAFEAVENYLASLRILSQEITEQHTAVASANHYLDLSLVRYRGGVDSYLNVITAQNAVLTSRETELQIQLRQMSASVSLVMALGGGWDASQLPSTEQLTAKQPKANPPGTTSPSSAPQSIAAPNPPPLPPAAAGHQP
jgi:NodT family efflux transporter outer membrane factor (OMF) lipoprotein